MFVDRATFERVLDRHIRNRANDHVRIAADILGCEGAVRAICGGLMGRVLGELPEAQFDFRFEGKTEGTFVFEVYVKEKEDREKALSIIVGSQLFQNGHLHYGHFVDVEVRVGFYN